jgi:hypothetical protein
MYKIIFFVPTKHKEIVKKTLFKIGCGKIGNYDCCSFESIGLGQFRPLSGAKPYIGTNNTIEKVEEYKIEIVCEDHLIHDAIKSLKSTHPYETPAYEVYKLENL